MNVRRITKLWQSVIGFTLLAMSMVQAQPTSIKLMAVKIEMSGSVRMAWTRPSAVVIDTFFVYRADNTSKAIRILATKDTAFTDILPLTFVAMSKYSYYVVGKPASGLLITSNTIFVQIAGIPPVGSFKLDAMVDASSETVKLQWTKPPVDSVVKYYIYRTSGLLSAAQKIDSTTGLTATDKPLLSSTGATPPCIGDNGTYRNSFTYFIVAKLPTISLQSTSSSVVLTVTVKRDVITFLTTQVTTARINVPYSARVLAKSSDSTAKLTYTLDKSFPPGMTLKDSAGNWMLKWWPVVKGMYPIHITVTSDKNGVANQYFTIVVTNSVGGIVQGKVTDTTGKAIAKVIIQLMQRDRTSHINYCTVTSATGEYRFSKIDPGAYILQAIPTTPDVVGQWWNGKYNADSADSLRVYDSTSVTSGTVANFTLRGRAVDVTKYVVVKGSVRDTMLIPVNVKGTQVTFVRADFALNSSTSTTDVTIDDFKKFFDFDRLTDFRLEGASCFSFRVGVDSVGNYTAKVPLGTYIALARAPGYATEFYVEHQDMLSANIMKLSADSSNINFTLSPLPPILLSTMTGTVMDTVNDIGVRSRVIAFRDRWATADRYTIAKSYTTDTDSMGKFTFTDLLPGSYIIRAVPLGSYAPAYYTDGSQTDTTKWIRATKVVVDSGKSISGIDIVVKGISVSRCGFTWITGNVRENTNATGLAGVLVFAHDKVTGEMAGYGVSDNTGKYAILGLAPGSYTVSVDKPGYMSAVIQTASPSYNAMSMGPNTVGVVLPSFTLEPAKVLSVTGAAGQPTVTVPTNFAVTQNYPNPFNPSTKFQLMLPATQVVSVKVYDLLGRMVATLVNGQKNAGLHTIEWNAASMPSGIYFYRVEAGASSAVKKMILMK